MVFIVAIALVYFAAGVIALVLLLDDGRSAAVAIPAAVVWPLWGGPYIWKRLKRAPGSSGVVHGPSIPAGSDDDEGPDDDG